MTGTTAPAELSAVGGGTRSRIQAVALELFAEQGYEKTSLREIAERLGVTKAALYYHFKSKDEIVESFVEDRVAAMDEMITWARSQPPGRATRRAILTRYADDLRDGRQVQLMRFFEQNQPTLKHMTAGARMRQRLFEVIQVLAGPDARPADRLRVGVSLFALHSSWFVLRDPDVTDQERREAALEVAYELLDRAGD